MPAGPDLHRQATRVLSSVMIVIGVALVVRTLSAGGGGFLGVILGVLFVAAGAGRLYVMGRGS